MKRQRTCVLLLVLWGLLMALSSAQAQTSFTYKGALPGSPTGNYDLVFWLYNTATGGTQVGSSISISNVAVSTGKYTVSLNFGANSFGDSPLYLAVAYRVHGTSTYTTLSTRVQEGARFASVSNSAQGLQGRGVSSTAPASGQVLKWNGSAWAPAVDLLGVYSAGAGLSLSGSVFAIASGGVVASMLASNSVTTSAIANGAVTAAKLATGSVTNSAIANGAVTSSDIATPLNLSANSGGDAFSMNNSGGGDAVNGYANTGRALYGYSSNGTGAYIGGGGGNGVNIYGYAGDGAYIYGSNNGVTAYSANANNYGVYASNTNGPNGYIAGGYVGVYAQGVDNAEGVFGVCNGTSGWGIYGVSDAGYAGFFSGNVYVTGTLSKAGGSFKIDHPMDPANKYLSHSFVESPDMMNVYNGIATLNSEGTAWIQMPNWFQTLNRDFRYQLTALGQPGPNLYIAKEMADNRFQIGGGQPGMRVSWQVTGIRQDAWANAHRIPVEEEKPEEERGLYLNPVENGQPESLAIDYARRQAITTKTPEAPKEVKKSTRP